MAGGSSVTEDHLRQLLLAGHLSPCRNGAVLKHLGLWGPPDSPYPPCPTAHLSFVTVPKAATVAGTAVTSMIGPAVETDGVVTGLALSSAGVAMVASGDTAMARTEATFKGAGQAASGSVLSTHSALRGRCWLQLWINPTLVLAQKHHRLSPNSCPLWDGP